MMEPWRAFGFLLPQIKEESKRKARPGEKEMLLIEIMRKVCSKSSDKVKKKTSSLHSLPVYFPHITFDL